MSDKSGNFLIGAVLPARWLMEGELAPHLALVRGLGHSAALVPLPWSQIEPQAGQFDLPVLARCRVALQSLRAADVEPVCILWDDDTPAWFEERGGWTHPKAAEDFQVYAAHAAKVLAQHCSWWVPLAEAEYRLAQAYPEKGRSGYRDALVQTVRAHNDCAKALRAVRPDASVGLSVRVFSAEPADEDSPWDCRAARRLEYRLNRRMAARLQETGGANAFDFVLASWGGVVSAWFSPRQWQREWVLTVGEDRQQISLQDARKDSGRFDETMFALSAHRKPLVAVGEAASHSELHGTLDAVAQRRVGEGGDWIKGFLLRAPVDRAEWERNSALLESMRERTDEPGAAAPQPNGSAFEADFDEDTMFT